MKAFWREDMIRCTYLINENGVIVSLRRCEGEGKTGADAGNALNRNSIKY